MKGGRIVSKKDYVTKRVQDGRGGKGKCSEKEGQTSKRGENF